jgi:hypothetical protein
MCLKTASSGIHVRREMQQLRPAPPASHRKGYVVELTSKLSGSFFSHLFGRCRGRSPWTFSESQRPHCDPSAPNPCANESDLSLHAEHIVLILLYEWLWFIPPYQLVPSSGCLGGAVPCVFTLINVLVIHHLPSRAEKWSTMRSSRPCRSASVLRLFLCISGLTSAYSQPLQVRRYDVSMRNTKCTIFVSCLMVYELNPVLDNVPSAVLAPAGH